jgi:hypothetical protein
VRNQVVGGFFLGVVICTTTQRVTRAYAGFKRRHHLSLRLCVTSFLEEYEAVKDKALKGTVTL